MFLKILGQIINLLNLLQITLVIKVQVFEQSVLEAKDPAVDDRELVFGPALLNCSGFDHVPALLVHVELDQLIVFCVLILDGVEFVLVQAVDVADVSEPRVEEAHILGGHGGLHATTAVVAAYNDVLDFEVADCVIDDRHHVEIDVVDEIGDVAVDKHLTGLQARDGFSRNTGIRAA